MTGARTVAAWAEWLTAEGWSPATRRARVGGVTRLAAHAGVDPLALAPAHVVAYLTRRPYKHSTRAQYLASAAMWARWAQIPDPTAGLRRPPPTPALPRPVTETQLGRLLADAAADPTARAWIVLGAYAGLRAAETAALTGAAVDIPGARLRVTGKGGRTGVVALPPIVTATLAPYVAAHGGGPLWPDADPHAVSRAVSRLSRAWGEGQALRYHQLRHRYGTALYSGTRDLLRTQRLMRHASAATTQRYVALVDPLDDEAVNGLPVPAA